MTLHAAYIGACSGGYRRRRDALCARRYTHALHASLRRMNTACSLAPQLKRKSQMLRADGCRHTRCEHECVCMWPCMDAL